MIITTNCDKNAKKKKKDKRIISASTQTLVSRMADGSANHSTQVTCFGLVAISKNNNIMVELVQGHLPKKTESVIEQKLSLESQTKSLYYIEIESQPVYKPLRCETILFHYVHSTHCQQNLKHYTPHDCPQ